MVAPLEELAQNSLARGLVNTIMFSAGTLGLANLIQYSRTYQKDIFSDSENARYAAICVVAFGALEVVKYLARSARSDRTE